MHCLGAWVGTNDPCKSEIWYVQSRWNFFGAGFLNHYFLGTWNDWLVLLKSFLWTKRPSSIKSDVFSGWWNGPYFLVLCFQAFPGGFWPMLIQQNQLWDWVVVAMCPTEIILFQVENLPTFTIKSQVNVGKYTIHELYGNKYQPL